MVDRPRVSEKFRDKSTISGSGEAWRLVSAWLRGKGVSNHQQLFGIPAYNDVHPLIDALQAIWPLKEDRVFVQKPRNSFDINYYNANRMRSDRTADIPRPVAGLSFSRKQGIS